MEDVDPDPSSIGWSYFLAPMEVMTSNGHIAVEDIEEVDILETGNLCEWESVTLDSTFSARKGASSNLDKEETMKADMKRRAFDEGFKDSQSPMKKLNVRSSSADTFSKVDPGLETSSLANISEAMNIDVPSSGIGGERKSDNQPYFSSAKQMSGSFALCTTLVKSCLEASANGSSEVPKYCETAQCSGDACKLEDVRSLVDCNVESPEFKRESFTCEPGLLEAEDMEIIKSPAKSAESYLVEPRREAVTLNGASTNGHVDSELEGPPTSTVTGEQGFSNFVDIETALNGHSVCLIPDVARKKIVEGNVDVAVVAPNSQDELPAPKIQGTPLSLAPSYSVKSNLGFDHVDSNSSSLPASSAMPNETYSGPTIVQSPPPNPVGAVAAKRSVADHTEALESSVNQSCTSEVMPAVERTLAKPEIGLLRDIHSPSIGHASGYNESFKGKGELAVAARVLPKVTSDEDVADDESGISEVDEVFVEKTDAANLLEEDIAGDLRQAPRNESTEEPAGIVQDTPIDTLLGVDTSKDGGDEKINEDAKMEELHNDSQLAGMLFVTQNELPEHLEGISGVHSGTLDTDELSDGRVSDDLRLNQEGHSNKQRRPSPDVPYSCKKCGVSVKDHDCPLESGSDNIEESSDRQESEVATPSVVTSAQSESSSLKLRLKLRGPVESPMKEAPASAKHLLASGLLEGHQVRYLGRGGQVMLTGIIQDGGVLCDCNDCKGLQVVNVSAFEKHAGSSARHPSDFIFLENGKCLKNVLEVGWNASKQKRNIMEVLKEAIGEAGIGSTKSRSCCKCGLREGELISCRRPRCVNKCHPGCCGVSGAWLCLSCEMLEKKPRVSLDSTPRMSLDTKSRSSSELKSRGTEGRAALTREGSVREKEPMSTPSLSREASGANLHKALFLPGGLPDGTELGYYVKAKKFLAGVKQGAGICCSCCQQVISCSLFEQHAGWGSRRNPYSSIYLADGRSLHEAAQSLVVTQQIAKQEGPTKIENVDYCKDCGDGGDLLLCGSCPSAYHRECLGSGNVPSGDFFCPDCQQQRFGGTTDRRMSMVRRRAKGTTKTVLTKDRITGRCTRLLKATEAVTLGGCVFCKSGDFAKLGFGPMTTLLCDQCEREYHVGCLKEHGLADLKELPEGEWFCGQDCKHIHSILSLLVANGPEPLADSIISKVLKNKSRNGRLDEETEPKTPSFEWQLLHGRQGDPVNGKTLAEAVQIFSECFDPIVDGTSGGDLIPLMVYRRSVRDQEFGGMYCVVLKQNDKVVSTALIRIFGRQLAELPLLATSPTHQGQGHCKALLLSIERLLGVLRVERLALPAAEGAEDIWLNKFDFTHMPQPQVKQFQADVNMMVFTGSSMLEKDVLPLEIS